MITVEIFCKYLCKDGLANEARIRTRCFSKNNIHVAKDRARKRFEKRYIKEAEPDIESHITMIAYDPRRGTYYDSDSAWCHIQKDNTVHYEIY